MNNTIVGVLITFLICSNIVFGVLWVMELSKPATIRRIETETVRTVELPGTERVEMIHKDCPVSDPVAEIQKELREADIIRDRLKTTLK